MNTVRRIPAEPDSIQKFRRFYHGLQQESRLFLRNSPISDRNPGRLSPTYHIVQHSARSIPIILRSRWMPHKGSAYLQESPPTCSRNKELISRRVQISLTLLVSYESSLFEASGQRLLLHYIQYLHPTLIL